MMREIKFRAWVASGTFVGMYYEEFTRYLGSFGVQFAQFQEWPDALMQYTGLKDKNGREIYEGDVFSWGVHTAEVKFVDGYFLFKDFGLHPCNKEGEVIGNIYENPDLLPDPPDRIQPDGGAEG